MYFRFLNNVTNKSFTNAFTLFQFKFFPKALKHSLEKSREVFVQPSWFCLNFKGCFFFKYLPFSLHSKFYKIKTVSEYWPENWICRILLWILFQETHSEIQNTRYKYFTSMFVPFLTLLFCEVTIFMA